MKRILVVAECININSTSEGICTSNFLNALSGTQYKVDCIYYQFVQHEVTTVNWISDKISLIKIPNTTIDFLIQYSRKIRSLYAKVLGRSLLRDRRSYRFKKYILPLLKLNHYDLVFVRTIAGSIASHKAVLELSRNHEFKWIAYFNDPVPRSMMPFPYNNAVDNYRKETIKTEKLVKNIVRACFGIASPSLSLTKHMLIFTGIGLNAKHVFEFPHVFIPDVVSKERAALNKYKMNILHAGTILEQRDPTHLINAFNRFIEKNPAVISYINLAFIGSVHTKYLDLINNSKYKKGILLINQRLPRNEIMGIISEADVLLIIEAASNESPFMPGKIADYIGLNKTILALSPEGSETRRILGKDYPYQCEPDDENSIHLIIDALYTKWSQGNSLNLNKPLLQDYVSSGHVIKEIEKIFLLK